MDPSGFLGKPQQESKLKLVSWNINAAKTKLDKHIVQNFLIDYDIISINEIKTPLSLSIPGYRCYKSVNVKEVHRGGTALFIKNYLTPFITNMDQSVPDQVWVQLSCVTGVAFGFCYVPPSDSPYFNHQSFSAIQEKIESFDGDKKFVVIGDFNARFGSSVRNLPIKSKIPDAHLYTYPSLPDDVTIANDNAYVLGTICSDNNLLVLNNLSNVTKLFRGGKTFKKKNEWISELDLCLLTFSLLDSVDKFKIHQTTFLPSDHAPISLELTLRRMDMNYLCERAGQLGQHWSWGIRKPDEVVVRKPIKIDNIDKDLFLSKLSEANMRCEVTDDLHAFAAQISESLYMSAASSRASPMRHRDEGSLCRWARLLSDPDDRRVWEAIDWKGKYQEREQASVVPSDQAFKLFYENSFGGVDQDVSMDVTDHNMYVPVLDDPITEVEVHEQIKKLKSGKASGPDGVSPGILKLLPAQYILMFSTLFNHVLYLATYPTCWTVAKFLPIFKKGDKDDVRNYRGINIINSIAKLYDTILGSRLEQWFTPFREQAGAQRGRGCTEHIVTLRLLMDIARKKKKKLYVTFVDFSSAYDRVSRPLMLTLLKKFGCGSVMLCAIAGMYQVTQSVVGTAVFSVAVGVRQGSPTSCLLFILYVNELIKLIKENCPDDGFLKWLHILMLMDDTVLLSTTRDRMKQKLALMKQYCNTYNMGVNLAKTKFFVVNSTAADKEPIMVDDLIVEWCDVYVYLGSPFTADGSIFSAVKVHAERKMKDINKFVSFVKKNNDIPFLVKKRVFDACLMSSLLYGCESWLNADLGPVNKLYHWALKSLLDVRRSTCNDICFLESGCPPLSVLVKKRQRDFFKSRWEERESMNDDPFAFALNTLQNYRMNTRLYVTDLLQEDPGDIQVGWDELKNRVFNSTASRRITYRTVINPSLEVHPIYVTKHNVSEHHRTAFTRFRVSAHSLAVEVGRWSRRGRGHLPLAERVCACGDVQTEVHVMEYCPLTQHIRDTYQLSSTTDLFSANYDYALVCKMIWEILEIYKD